MNNSIFMATPISGFGTKEEYYEYRKEALQLISYLRNEGYDVNSEIERIGQIDLYDSPAKSVEDDFNSIKENDFFLMLHPAKMQTSTLIEFGFACAQEKRIVVVADKKNLPYLVIGYQEYSKHAKIIEVEKLNAEVFSDIVKALRSV